MRDEGSGNTGRRGVDRRIRSVQRRWSGEAGGRGNRLAYGFDKGAATLPTRPAIPIMYIPYNHI